MLAQRPISGRLRARSMTLIMGVYGISEVLVNIEDMSGRDIYETNCCAEMREELFRIIVNPNNNYFIGQIQI